MNWGKAIGILLLMIITSPFGGFIWVPVLFFGWKYVKFCIKIDLILIYLIVRLPIWFFIQLPLYSLKVSTGKIERFFMAGYNKMMRARKLAVFLIVIFGLFFMFLFSPAINFSSPNLLSVAWWYSTLKSSLFVAVAAVGSTMMVLSAKEAFSGNIAQGEMPGEWARSELGSAPGDAVAHSTAAADKNVERAKKAKGVYDDLKAVKSGEKSLGRAASPDMLKKFGEIDEMIGLDLLGGAGAEGAGGAIAASGGTLLLVALIIFLLALVFFVVQLAVVMFFFISYIQIIAPMILGPLAAALGLGADYGNWIGQTVANDYFAGFTVSLEDEFAAAQEARQRVYCLLQGPACLRQWRLNNTQNPGSDSVGETYGLKLDRFEVGSGNQVDVAYKDGGYQVPISFGLSNTRHGLKGINAYNVSYRLKMIDFGRGRGDPYCKTNWRPVDGYDLKPDDDIAVNTEDGRIEYSENDLYPGTSASTGFIRLEKFSLENCGLLQPGAGSTRTLLLEVKYDYSSQATLYFEAMSRENLRSDSSITKQWEKSVTADTPVKSVINVNSPVLYDQDTLEAQAFSMRARLNTDDDDVEYKVKDLVVRNSDSVQIAEGERSEDCQFTRRGDRLVPSGSAADILVDRQDNRDAVRTLAGDDTESDGTSQDQRWFSNHNSPPFFGCTMQLSDPGSINPSGETLTMGVRSNYTVKLREQMERFEAINTQCSELDCPLLVTQQFAQNQERPKNWKIKCEGPDSSDGCSVVEGDPTDWSTVTMFTGNDKLDKELEGGEIAFDPEQSSEIKVVDDLEDQIETINEDLLPSQELDIKRDELAIGLTRDQIRKIRYNGIGKIEGADGGGYAIVSARGSEGREVELRELDHILCYDQGGKDHVENFYRDEFFSDTTNEDTVVIGFEPIYAQCSKKSTMDAFLSEQKLRPSLALGPAALLAENYFRGLYSSGKAAVRQFEDVRGDCSGIVVMDGSGLSCIEPEEDSG